MSKILQEMALADLKKAADDSGVFLASEQEIMSILSDLEVDENQKCPVDMINDDTGEVIIEKGDRFSENSYWRTLHGLNNAKWNDNLQKAWDEEEADSIDDNIYVSGKGLEYLDNFEAAYDVEKVWFADYVEDPEEMLSLGYDVEIEVPSEIRRLDNKMFNDGDVNSVVKYEKTYNSMYSGNRKMIVTPQTDVMFVGVDIVLD